MISYMRRFIRGYMQYWQSPKGRYEWKGNIRLLLLFLAVWGLCVEVLKRLW